MGRENKKEAIASLHREQMMQAAEELFWEKGYAQTTIADISKSSGYSRRTIYAYYESKDDILYHIIEKGLTILKQEIEKAISCNDDFIEAYRAIWTAMRQYQKNYPYSAESVNRAQFRDLSIKQLSVTGNHILSLGTEINHLLIEWIETGKKQGVVRKDTIASWSVYILWSGISALVTLEQTKGEFISKQSQSAEKDFLAYGFRQLINSILEVRI